MTASVQVENPDGGLRELSPDILDTLDFGKVRITFHDYDVGTTTLKKSELYIMWHMHIL